MTALLPRDEATSAAEASRESKSQPMIIDDTLEQGASEGHGDEAHVMYESADLEDEEAPMQPAQLGQRDEEEYFSRSQRFKTETIITSTTPMAGQIFEDFQRQQRRERSRSRGRDDEELETVGAILAETQAISTSVKGNRREQMMGKTSRYEHSDKETRDGMDRSRAKGWESGSTLEQV